MVHVDSIRRRFGVRVLFEDLSWTIPRGSRLGLVGPNGAGKTTLLRILAGMDSPDGGQLRRPSDLRVGYLPQEVETLADGSVLATVLDGFGELRRLTQDLEAAELRLASIGPGDPAIASASAAYGELRHRFEAMGGDGVEVRAKTILSGLGVPASSVHDPLARLSGGWRMRVALARLLLGSPDLLLLDEPTNHLDLEATQWLEGFLAGFPGAFVVVSHDRYFLNRMVRGIVELEGGRLTVFSGGYDEYLAARETRRAAAEKAIREQALEAARVQRFIERFRYKATKARQVQSRIRALEKVEQVETPVSTRRIRFGFPAAPRSGDVVARARGLAKAFGATVVYREASFLIRRGDRVALVGPNGAGKSTLLKLLDGRVAPDAGSLELGQNVIVQYYAQHQLDALDPQRSVLEELQRRAEPGITQKLRGILGRFLFSGNDVDKRVEVLSGGEKARLALAAMLIRPANLLLLDEPTNHLDLRSREVLEEALDEYDGTMVLVSHDRYFINRVANAIGEVGMGAVDIYPGDYDTYLERRASRAAADPSAPPDSAKDEARQRERDLRRIEAEQRNRRYRERRAVEERLAPIEAAIAALEARVRRLTELQAEPDTYRDSEKARSVGREKAEAEEQLAGLYESWEAVASELHGS